MFIINTNGFCFADEFSREPSTSVPLMDEGDDRPIEPISDIGIHKVNALMFNNDVK